MTGGKGDMIELNGAWDEKGPASRHLPPQSCRNQFMATIKATITNDRQLQILALRYCLLPSFGAREFWMLDATRDG